MSSPDLPVAVVTAGAFRADHLVKQLQVNPAERARRGYVEHVAGSTHANLLGPRHADAVVRGVAHVLAMA